MLDDPDDETLNRTVLQQVSNIMSLNTSSLSNQNLATAEVIAQYFKNVKNMNAGWVYEDLSEL